MPLLFLWIQICLVEKGRLEKFCDADLKPLAQLVDDPKLYGVVGTLHNIVYGGFGYAALGVELVLSHAVYLQQFQHSAADRLIQLHDHHRTFLLMLLLYVETGKKRFM